MNFKTTMILVLLAVVAGGLLLVNQMGWFNKAPSAPADTGKILQPLTPDFGKVMQATVETSAGKTVLVRKGDDWQLGGLDAPATRNLAENAAASFAGLRFTKRFAPGGSDYPKDDQTHLSAPAGTVTLVNDKGVACTIKFGQKLPMSAQRYVQLSGKEDVYVIDTDVMALLNRQAEDYRDRTLCPFKTDQARKLVVGGQDRYTLVKVDGKWAVESPSPGKADDSMVWNVLNAMAKIQAEKFVESAPKSLAPYNLDNPRLTVSVDLADDAPAATGPAASGPTSRPTRTLTLAFSPVVNGKVFAKLADKPWVAQVNAADIAQLQPKLLDIRSKLVLDIGLQEITRLDIQLRGQPSATLEKADSGWKLTAPLAGPANTEQAEKLVKALQDLKATDFADASATPVMTGLDQPAAKITIRLRGSDKTSTLLVGAHTASNEMGYVQQEGSTSVAVVPAAAFDALAEPFNAYWQRTLLELPNPIGLSEIKLQRDGQTIAIAQSGFGKYTLTAPAEGPADFDNVEAVLAAAQTLRADKIISVDKQLPDKYKSAKGAITAVFSYRPAGATTASAPTTAASAPTSQAAPKLFTLVLVKDNGKTYAWRAGDEVIAVGEMDGAIYDKFNAEMRDRTAFKFDAAKVTGFTITAGEKTIELTKSGTDWIYAADRFVKIDAPSVQKFLEGMSAVKAVRFVDIPADKADLTKPAKTLQIQTEDGKTHELKVSAIGPENGSDLYAGSSQSGGVFIIPMDTAKRISANLADFRQPAAPEPGAKPSFPMGQD